MGGRGFTLIELVMVIVILGILAVVAIPRYIDLRADARIAAADGVVAAGNAGAQIWRANYLIGNYTIEYPVASDSACCFEDITVPSISGVTFSYDAAAGSWSYSTT